MSSTKKIIHNTNHHYSNSNSQHWYMAAICFPNQIILHALKSNLHASPDEIIPFSFITDKDLPSTSDEIQCTDLQKR